MNTKCAIVISVLLSAIGVLGFAYYEVARTQPIYEFCGRLQATPLDKRVDLCAEQNTTGPLGLNCSARPFKDAHGKVVYTIQLRFAGDKTSRCTVEP